MNAWFFVLIYLVAIVAANLSVVVFGPASTIVNAFLFIGLDLVARDRLHEAWCHRGLIGKMTLLIGLGSGLSWLINRDASQIALASFVAFAVASLADTLVYELGRRWGWTWLIRSNASNVAGAMVDSLLFPTLAFGQLLPLVTLGQMAAKIAGGLIWSWILRLARPIARDSCLTKWPLR